MSVFNVIFIHEPFDPFPQATNGFVKQLNKTNLCFCIFEITVKLRDFKIPTSTRVFL